MSTLPKLVSTTVPALAAVPRQLCIPFAFEADDVIVRVGRGNLLRRARTLQRVGGALAIRRPIAIAKWRCAVHSNCTGLELQPIIHLFSRGREYAGSTCRHGVGSNPVSGTRPSKKRGILQVCAGDYRLCHAGADHIRSPETHPQLQSLLLVISKR
jgi:hypothetical protein